MKFLIFVVGLLTNFLLFGIFLLLLNHPEYGMDKIDLIRTVIFAGLAVDSFLFIFSFRNLRKNIWQYNPFSNLYVNAAALGGFLLIIAAVYLPVFQTLLKTQPLGLFEWTLLFFYGLIDVALIEMAKYWFIVRKQV